MPVCLSSLQFLKQGSAHFGVTVGVFYKLAGTFQAKHLQSEYSEVFFVNAFELQSSLLWLYIMSGVCTLQICFNTFTKSQTPVLYHYTITMKQILEQNL